MDCITDHGAVPHDLGPLRAAVLDIPRHAWVYRSDPESDRTCVVGETDSDFPHELVSVAIAAAVAAFLPPGYANRIVLSCVPAGERILPHSDDFGASVRARSFHCHIPLVTHRAAVLGFPDRRRVPHLEAGHLYSIDETERHFVDNPSGVDRIHLLFAHFPHDGRGRPFME